MKILLAWAIIGQIALSPHLLKANEETIVNDPLEVSKLNARLDQEILTLTPKKIPATLQKHFEDIYTQKAQNKLKITFIRGSKNIRGYQTHDSECNCDTIFLNADLFHYGPVSTLVHEFEHIKQKILISYLMKNNPDFNNLVTLFGQFYYDGDLAVKNNPLFKNALYVGSLLLFYMEYDAFKLQIMAIKSGIKDNLRTEQTNKDIIEMICENYFTDHSIKMTPQILMKWARLADQWPLDEFIKKGTENRQLKDEFLSLAISPL